MHTLARARRFTMSPVIMITFLLAWMCAALTVWVRV
jgi:hypothetical protein